MTNISCYDHRQYLLRHFENVILMYHSSERFSTAMALQDYLLSHTKTLLVVTHPLSFANDRRITISFFIDGRVVTELQFDAGENIDYREAKTVFKEIVFLLKTVPAIRQISKSNKTIFDIAIGVDPVFSVVTLLLKKMGISKNAISAYFNDVAEQRFKNTIMNLIYRNTIRFCLNRADCVWYIGPKMRTAIQRTLGNVNEKAYLFVPNGTYIFDNCDRLICSGKIISARILIESSGLQLVIQALPEVIKKVPTVEFLILGQGPYEGQLRRLVKDLMLEDHVKFLGFRSHKEVMEIMSRCDIGVATYMPTNLKTMLWPSNNTEDLDGTVSTMEFFAAGLPIIATRGMGISEVIEKNRAGIVISWNREEVHNAILKLFDPTIYAEMARNSKHLGVNYDWNKIFSSALEITAKVLSDGHYGKTQK